MLKFSIPLNDQIYAVVYNSISIIKPGKDKVPPKIITIPDFPNEAPELPERVIELKDKPVITEGTIKAIAFEDLITSESAEEDDDSEENEDEEDSAKKPEAAKKKDSEQ